MTRTPVPEAALVETEAGLKPDGPGWFVVNLAHAAAIASPGAGYAFTFEPGEPMSWANPDRFPHFGVNVQVLAPGEPASLYHAEDGQEAFLVLQGECVLVVEEQERRLRQWDFAHMAPGTAHVFAGTGTEPCAILMIGARNAGHGVLYPASPLAARYGASAEHDTASPEEAYAGWSMPVPARGAWPPSATGGA